MKSTQEIVANVDEVFELVKKIKSTRNRYQGKYEKVEAARQEVSDLKSELVEVSQAMFDNHDTSALRDPAAISRDITRAESRYEKAIERNADDVSAMDALCARLAELVGETPVEVEDLDVAPDEHGSEIPSDPSDVLQDDSIGVGEEPCLEVETERFVHDGNPPLSQQYQAPEMSESDTEEEMDFTFSEHLDEVGTQHS